MAESKGNFFVHRPIVAMVIAIVIVIVGGVSVIGLAIEQYPNLTPPIVEVRATYTGANALNVEESVATPIEQEMNGQPRKAGSSIEYSQVSIRLEC